MSPPVLSEPAYRFRATLRGRWPGYLALVVLIGLLGGLAMGAIAGARRTQSSFPVYLASTNPSQLEVFTEFDPLTGTGYSQRTESDIARLPYLKHVADVIGFDGTLQALSVVRLSGSPGESPPAFEGSPNGDYFSQDLLSVVKGRMPDASRLDEIVMSAGAAAETGLRLGSTIRLAFFTDAQVNSPSYAGFPKDEPDLTIALHLVGIVKSSEQVVQDDDAALHDQLAVITPALTRRLERCCAYYTYAALKLDGGARHEAVVLAGIHRIVPNLGPFSGPQTYAPVVAQAERVIRPEAIAFGVFGLIVVIAALVISGQVVSRLVRRDAHDAAVLRALGAGPAMIAADEVMGALGAIVAGSVLAAVVAVGLSPLAPIGPVRSVYPDRGVAFDWTVIGLGPALLVVVLSGTAVLVAYRALPHRPSEGPAALEVSVGLARAATVAGLPPTAVTGIRSAIGAGAGRDAAAMRSALLGAVIAVVVVVGSVTFGSSLTSLVSHPALYGWNWDYALEAGFSGEEDLPAAETASLLDHDPDVAHWAGVFFETINVDGFAVPALAMSPGATVSPPVLSGHALEAASEIVLGAATLSELHEHLGETVSVNTGRRYSTRLRVVGTATLPSLGASTPGSSLDMGTGAIVSPALFSAASLDPQGSAVPGPMAVLIKISPIVGQDRARHSLAEVAQVLDRPTDPDAPIGGVVSVLRPAEIANYRTLGSTPAVLAGILAAGAIGALGLTLVASVRRRRREFALLKTLGFTERQLAATVAWQSSVAALVGVVFGVPLGIVLGRWLWSLFARGISAVPDPTVPALWVFVVAIGALLFANLVAIFPGRVAARTPSAVLLRTE